jgi:hypothetical protein
MKIIEVEDLVYTGGPSFMKSKDEVLENFAKGPVLNHSSLNDELLDGGHQAFLTTMYICYSQHRPFVLTPEAIWLVILQAFSVHINNNPGKLIEKYPNLANREKLIVRLPKSESWSDEETCRNIVKKFTDGLKAKIPGSFVENLSDSFSNSTPDEVTTFQITTMHTLKAFFEFIVISVICGIPRIKLQGTVADWHGLANRLKELRDYNFGWYVDKILPHVERISESFGAEPADDFWINMFKIHTTKDYGSPKYVDGWITDFFPWSKTGERLADDYFKTTSFNYAAKNLSPQAVSVDVTYRIIDEAGEIISEQPLHFTAGFLGIREDPEDHTLEPSIGWMISENSETLKSATAEHEYDVLEYHNLEAFPSELLTLEGHREIGLNFSSQISIPEAFADLEISSLNLKGRINQEEWNNIRRMFAKKETYVSINRRSVKAISWEEFISDMKQLSAYRDWFTEY